MNLIYRNSLIKSIFTAFILVLTIKWPQYFLYYFFTIIVSEVIFWGINYSVGLNLECVKDKVKYLILPFLFNIGFIVFLQGIFSDILKFLFLVVIMFFNFYLYVALKRVHNLEDKAAIFYRNIIISSAFFAILFSLSALFRFYVSQSISASFRVPLSIIVIVTFGIFYSVTYFLAFENGVDIKKFNPYLLVISLLGGEMALIGLIWIVNYPVYTSTEKGNLSGLPLPAIVLTIVYYFVWGVFSHKIDHSLTKRVIIEYILFTTVFIFILLITAKWLPNF